MRLIIEPKDSLIHEDVRILVEDLEPNTNYEFLMKMLHHTGTFCANGIYNSGSLGVIDLSVNEPIRGSYSGKNPQALFHVQQPTSDVRFGQYCTSTPPNPYYYELQIKNSVGEILATEKLVKRWLHPAVTRTEIEEGDIRGTLFKPPGDGPFPTIIDISGTGGGLHEHKGAALASRGFCVFSLAFFQYKDLISDLSQLDINYFKNAIKWLISQPYTSDRIGFQGVSFGGLLVSILATECPECALDDLSTPTVFVTNYFHDKLRKLGRYVEVDMQAGGHLMDPPCFPIHCSIYSKLIGGMQAYGGEPTLHGYSQMIVWANTVRFFERFLGEPPELPNYRKTMENLKVPAKI